MDDAADELANEQLGLRLDRQDRLEDVDHATVNARGCHRDDLREGQLEIALEALVLVLARSSPPATSHSSR